MLLSFEEKLARLGLSLPTPVRSLQSYAPVVSDRGTVFIGGQLPIEGDRVAVVGQVGTDVPLEDARYAARLAVLQGLAVLQAEVGSLDRITRILKLNVYVQCAPGFMEQNAVADAASNLLCELFGTRGIHTRTVIGVSALPGDASVGLDIQSTIVSEDS